MTLSQRSLHKLLDLIDTRIGGLDVLNRADARELTPLVECREELRALEAMPRPAGEIEHLVRRARVAGLI